MLTTLRALPALTAAVLAAGCHCSAPRPEDDDVAPGAESHHTGVDPEPPPGLGAPCESDADCDEGLVCILESPDVFFDLHTCQLPCGWGVLCAFEWGGCYNCFEASTPMYCQVVDCH